jgi:calcium-translocating P-type ATPase
MAPEAEPDPTTGAWHALPVEAVLGALGSEPSGLSQAEAEARLARHGPNRLPMPGRRATWRRLLAQFNNVLIYLLLFAGLVTALFGQVVDSAVIFAVVLVNALIGFAQEGKAERALEAIGRMVAPNARVMRDGHRLTVAADSLVRGDIVRLKAGDRVPADLRLVESHGLRVDEAALTGESVPVSKRTAPVAKGSPLAERSGMAHGGTLVAAGQGMGVVVATASATELGRIGTLLGEVRTLTTPLLRDVARFATWLSLVIVIVAVAVLALTRLLHGTPWTEGVLIVVALAVAAIPEGLPAIITITLAVGVQRMAQRNAVIRRLPAVETLGGVSVICTDKTGTLTRNELVAVRIGLAGGEMAAAALDGRARDLIEAGALCNEASPGGEEGDPVERALVGLAHALDVDVQALREGAPLLALRPFSSEAKLMATRHPERICVKGAPETILARCERQRDDHGESQLDHAHWLRLLDGMARGGLRVLAIAEATPADGDASELPEGLVAGGLCLLGLVAFIDPPRREVPAAVAACRDAGIAVKMITGDHAATASAIARELGFGESGATLTGSEIDGLDDAGLAACVDDVDVYARTSPEHKLRLVRALQARGRIVAMTGDGANDAPALKRADVGVAMGIKGTEAAREAAEVVLADDNFASIVAGVEEGRGVNDNIRKALLFILPTSAAEALVVLVAALAGVSLPITPVQILWVNMVTAVTLALALAFEPLEQGILARPPRAPGRALVTAFMVWRAAWVGLLLTVGIFWLFTSARASGIDLAAARTVAVNALVAGEAVYLFNARRWIAPGWTLEALLANRWAWLSVAVLALMQAALTYWPPAQAVFGTDAIGPREWLGILVLVASLFAAVEVEKAWFRRRRGRRRDLAASRSRLPGPFA